MTDNQLFSVASKVIAVTGGSSGLGQKMARLLANNGACIISFSRNHDSDQFCLPDGETLNVVADVTRPDSVSSAFDDMERFFGLIDALFNNAGVAHVARALDTTRDVFEHMLSVSVTGAFFTAQEVAKCMISRGSGGVIVNTTSILAERSQKSAAAYAMSKACVSQMTRALALEFAPYDIRVNAIAPVWFPTRINEQHLAVPVASFLKALIR